MTARAGTGPGPRGAAVPVAVALAVALAAAGGQLAWAAWQERPSPSASAEVDGVALHVRRAVWLDHALLQRDATVHAMLPGLPEHLHRRLAVSFIVENRTASERRFTWQDLVLRWPRRDAFASSRDGRASIVLPPHHAALLDAAFDVPEGDDPVTLWWERGAVPARLLETRVPLHGLPERPATIAEWPRLASGLPRGRADAGARLYRANACASCHGDPAAPGSNAAAPHLGGIGALASHRVAGQSAEQYLYESLLDPDSFVAKACAGPGPCAQARMPPYGETLSVQEVADLVAYLLEQGRAP
ncbi:MAG: c-type cytochrome [Anaeromyxobacteraceae bacterium]